MGQKKTKITNSCISILRKWIFAASCRLFLCEYHARSPCNSFLGTLSSADIIYFLRLALKTPFKATTYLFVLLLRQLIARPCFIQERLPGICLGCLLRLYSSGRISLFRSATALFNNKKARRKQHCSLQTAPRQSWMPKQEAETDCQERLCAWFTSE